MYSVILMAALTTNGPDAVSWGRRGFSCTGCCGGSFSCVGCSGCSGCYGNYGGSCRGWGWGSGGWHSTVTYDYSPGWAWSACYGGCYGSCMGCTGHMNYNSCYGGCYGTPIWYGPGTAMPGVPSHDSNNPMTPPPAKPAAPKAPDATPGSARLIIDAPGDANLFIDNMPYRVEKDRQFATPTLNPGQTYYYTVRVEMHRDGKPVNETRRVLVRANEVIHESFGVPTNATAVAKDSR